MTGVADDLFEADASQRKERASVPSVRVGGRLAEAIIWMIWSGGDEDHAHSSYVPPTVRTDCYLHWRCWIFFFQALSGNRPNEMQPGANKQPNSRLSLQPQTATTGVQEGGHGFSDGSAVAVGLWKRLAVQIAQVRPRQARWSRRRVLDESSALPVSHAHHQS